MSTLSFDFMQKIAKALEEEETDIYALSLYSLNSHDLSFFGEANQARIRQIFKVLIDDTQRHAELLKLIVEMGARP